MKSVCFMMILMLYVMFNMYRNSLIVTWTPKNRQKQAKNLNQIKEMGCNFDLYIILWIVK